MNDLSISPEDLNYIGSGLMRPECVLATESGDLYVADARGGVCHIAPGGAVTRIGGVERREDAQIIPNGIALLPDGSFLLANLHGGVYRLERSGALTPYLLEVDGKPLEVTNFVLADRQGRIWITISTRRIPRDLGYHPDVDDGYIVCMEAGRPESARIVADGLGFTNECVLDGGVKSGGVTGSGEFLYVNETFARRLSRYPLKPDGSLGARETVTTFGAGTFPDGVTVDAQGCLWVTAIISNRVIRVTPDGEQQIVIEDSDPAHVEFVEGAYLAGGLGREHLDRTPARYLKQVSSLAFGGPGLRTAYLGNLLDERIAWFESPVAGLEPPHWRW